MHDTVTIIKPQGISSHNDEIIHAHTTRNSMFSYDNSTNEDADITYSLGGDWKAMTDNKPVIESPSSFSDIVQNDREKNVAAVIRIINMYKSEQDQIKFVYDVLRQSGLDTSLVNFFNKGGF